MDPVCTVQTVCVVLQDSLIIGARFDVDKHGEQCRLAFYGRLLSLVDPDNPGDMKKLKVYKVWRVLAMVSMHVWHLCTCCCNILELPSSVSKWQHTMQQVHGVLPRWGDLVLIHV